MKNDLKVSPQPPARAGFVHVCSYCGEEAVGSSRFCKICKTKSGREDILKQNVEILEELRSNNYCKGEVLLMKP